MVTEHEIKRKFMQAFDCSQVVLMSAAEELGYDEEEMARMAAAFGGGMFHGDTCGCVTGALIALGMRYGHCEADDRETKGVMMEKVKEFRERFAGEFGTTECRKLIGYDFSVPEEAEGAKASGILLERCPKYAAKAAQILAEMLDE